MKFVFEPVRLVKLIEKEVSDPDPASGLYSVPFRLSREPSQDWIISFIQAWRSRSQHPCIAQVKGARITLDLTKIEDVRDTHSDVLKQCVEQANIEEAGRTTQLAERESAAIRPLEEHRENVHKVASQIRFDK
jgi:hypothetical protein